MHAVYECTISLTPPRHGFKADVELESINNSIHLQMRHTTMLNWKPKQVILMDRSWRTIRQKCCCSTQKELLQQSIKTLMRLRKYVIDPKRALLMLDLPQVISCISFKWIPIHHDGIATSQSHASPFHQARILNSLDVNGPYVFETLLVLYDFPAMHSGLPSIGNFTQRGT